MDERLREMYDAGRAPVWELGDSWCFGAEVSPFPCQSAVPSTFRLRCGHGRDLSSVPQGVEFRTWAAPPGFADDLPEEFWQLPYEPVASLPADPGLFRLSLPTGLVFIQFRIPQPWYRDHPWTVSPWMLVVG